MNKRKKPMTF